MVSLNERYAGLRMNIEYRAAGVFREVMQAAPAVGRENSADHKLVEGLGTPEMRIPELEFKLAHRKYAHLYPGSSCWYDPEFRKAYRRDNPHTRVSVTRNTKGNEIPKGTIYVPPKYAPAEPTQWDATVDKVITQ